MLKIIASMAELDTGQLMKVYSEGNRENGAYFFPDASPEEQLRRAEAEFLSYLREDFFRCKGAFYCVWVENGCYQSALRLEPYNDGYLLEALETAPEGRRKGYATLLIKASLAYLKTRSCKAVYSHVGKKNVPSLAVHTNCGFQLISDSANYIDGTVTQSSCTLCCYL